MLSFDIFTFEKQKTPFHRSYEEYHVYAKGNFICKMIYSADGKFYDPDHWRGKVYTSVDEFTQEIYADLITNDL